MPDAATANLSALRAAAVSGDRFAMLLLADLAEEQGDDARAGAWRWLTDPPRKGWERRAWGMALAHGGWFRAGPGLRLTSAWADSGFKQGSMCVREDDADGATTRIYFWRLDGRGWRDVHDRPGCPPEVREAVLYACQLALAGAPS